jgi:PAS domain S-box-containing protein
MALRMKTLAAIGAALAGLLLLQELTARGGHFRTGTVVAVGLAFVALTPWLVQRLVLARLSRDAREVRHEPADLERALRAANEYNRGVIEACLDPLVIVDANGRITDVNAAAQSLVGHMREKLLATDLAGYVTEPGRARAACADAFAGGIVRDYALEIRHADGHTTPVRCNASVYRDHAGNTVGVCAVLRDVTERRRREAELKQTREAAQRANSAKSEFLANMSHEIRTPMTAILGYVELIADGCRKECPFGRETLARHADIIARNAKYLLDLLNDTLDLSKIEAGRLQVEPAPCSLPELLADLDSLMRVRATAKGLALCVRSDGAVPRTICTDPTRLRQILINLLGNAIKFTEQGSVHLVVRLHSDGPLEFEISDSGIGMTPEQITRLFHPFAQGDSSIHRRFGGTGLGLSISRRLAELLGGRIAVESQSGAGSVFRLTLATGPLTGVELVSFDIPAHTARFAKSAAADIKLSGRILLAEDGPDNQRLIALLLRLAGADVTTVENGQMAVDAALQALESGRPFDVILMDIQMPVLDGYEATRHLRRKGYTAPIVALTAHAMIADREECLAAGCDDFAAKPIDRAMLLGVVAAHLRGGVATVHQT